MRNGRSFEVYSVLLAATWLSEPHTNINPLKAESHLNQRFSVFFLLFPTGHCVALPFFSENKHETSLPNKYVITICLYTLS